MFGNLGQIAQLLKNAGQIREQAKTIQDRLAAARFVGEAGAGQVQATVDGRGDLISIRIDPALIAGGDAELVEELVTAGVREAVRISRAAAQKEMESVTGMNLQNVMDLFGGGGGKP